MTGSVIGENTAEFVSNQVRVRQETYGKGLINTVRTPQDIQFMNNRNAWIKMASSVSILDENLRTPANTGNPSNFKGEGLATKAILFNGLSELQAKLQMRAGVNAGANAILPSTSYFNNSAYGLGGNDFGILPMPGINSISIDSKNRGSIKTATIQITAFNRYQFEIIETLYCRLGFSMILEWGWDKYIDNDGVYQTVGSTVVEDNFFQSTNQDDIVKAINEKTLDYSGNTGGLFGKVVNFNWKYDADGSYKITVKMTGLGDVIESMKINQSPSKALKETLKNMSHERLVLLKEAKSTIDANKTVTKLGTILYRVLNKESVWSGGGNGDYFNLFQALQNSSYNSFLGGNTTSGIKIEYNYFIRFGELLNLIETHITPDINNNNKIKFTEFDKQTNKVVCSIQPNLISFDPAVCMVKMDDGTNLNRNDINGINIPDYTKSMKEFTVIEGNSSGTPPTGPTHDIVLDSIIYNPQTVESFSAYDPSNNSYEYPSGTTQIIPSDFTFKSQTARNPTGNAISSSDMIYGKILNIYLNYDMIFATLSKNVDKKGNLTFFKFLQSMCDNINSAFANVIDIEPIIKDDKVITFMDTKPIEGLSSNMSKLVTTNPTETAHFEVVGFDLGTSQTQPQGTFLKNISFNTKFSPKLASQLSIGATANGVALGQDATGLSKWNSGLVDRFQQTIEDPDIVATSINTGGNTSTGNSGQTSVGNRYAGNSAFLQSLLVPVTGTQLSNPALFPMMIDLGIKMSKTVVIRSGLPVLVHPAADVETIKIFIDDQGKIIGSNYGGGDTTNPDGGKDGFLPIKQDTVNVIRKQTLEGKGVNDTTFMRNVGAKNTLLDEIIQDGFDAQEASTANGTNPVGWKATNFVTTVYMSYDIHDTDEGRNTFEQDFLKRIKDGVSYGVHIKKEIIKGLALGYGLQTPPDLSSPKFSNSNNREVIRNNVYYPTFTPLLNWRGQASTNNSATGAQRRSARALAGANYSAYLAQMFGGTPNVPLATQQALNIQVSPISKTNAEYTFRKAESSFAKAGKSAYKIYLDEANNRAAANNPTKEPSNQIGLLPIEFSMDMEGIAGFRIYNKIDINQRFLPSNYANSLQFLIKGINHKIDGSGWTTNLQTLSTSNLNAKPNTGNTTPVTSVRSTNNTSQAVQALLSANPAPQITAYSGDPRLQPIKDMIALHESRNKYDIANQGSRGGYSLTKATIPDNTVVVGKTIVELLDQRSTTFSSCLVPICTFAMGRYQIIPNTLKSLLRSTTGVSTTDIFSPANQEKLCDTLLFNSRPNIGKYIDGTVPGTKQELSKAVQSLAQEWASMPATIKDNSGNTNVGNVTTGAGNTGYYQGTVNRSTTSETVGDIVKALVATRRLYLAGQSNQEPSFVPSYV